MPNYVIIGASHAGLSFAEKMRQHGMEDPITVIDRLHGMPMQRPPLSKAFLGADETQEDNFYLRRSDWFDEQNITLKDGLDVIKIDREQKQLHLADGSLQNYDRLVLAQGAVPRRLPFPEMNSQGVHVLRHGDDARAIKAMIGQLQRAIVIGGGYIGLEAAASLNKAGLDVTVIEAADRLLARVASPSMSDYYKQLHQDNGVKIELAALVDGLQAEDGHIRAVCLKDGRILPCDLLLVGIGVVPDTALAEQAGLTIGNGILTDYHYQTNDDSIWAIGDIVLAEGRGSQRIESIHNAQFSGHYLASQFSDGSPPANEASWFWSDQFDRKLQSAGLVPAIDDTVVQVSRTGRRETSLSIWSYQAGKLVAVEAVNDPQAYMIGKICLEQNKHPEPSDIGNADFDLKSLR